MDEGDMKPIVSQIRASQELMQYGENGWNVMSKAGKGSNNVYF